MLVRCELDALPIGEPNNFAYRSRNAGYSHKCGHDGHMAIVAGLAPWLQEQTFAEGRVILLFQPAEETGEGANAIMKDPKWAALQPDLVLALHNIPGAPMHQIIRVQRQFSATVQSVAIRLSGQQSHAAEPEKGRNPAWAMAEITQAAREWSVTDPTAGDFALITPVFSIMGQQEYGISAGYGELHFTLRTWSVEEMDRLVRRLENKIKTSCDAYRLEYELSYFDYFPATVNDPAVNQLIGWAAESVGLALQEKAVPFKFGEDFGWFTQHYSGAMFGLGAGEESPDLHNDYYDFPDELIDTGIEMFRELIRQILGREQ